MKICQLCAIDFTHHHLLVNLHRALMRAGHSVTLVSSDGPLLDALRDEGMRVKAVPIGRNLNVLGHFITVVRLIALFRSEQFDLVHVHTPIAGLLGRIAARLAGVPRVVYTAHGFYFHENMPRWLYRAHVLIECVGGRLTDLLFVQSGEDAVSAETLGIIPADRIVTIGNGVHLERFERSRRPETRAVLTRTLGLPHDAVVVTTVGRLVAEKGYSEFFSAASRIVAAGSGNVHFLAVGQKLESDRDDSLAREIRRIAADPILSRHVHMLGYRDDVADILVASDIFVLASYREGMPRCVIEAMASALPVVGTRIRGIREEVVEEQTGLLVPVGDAGALAVALMRLVHDPELARAWGEAGLRRARGHFDEAKVIGLQVSTMEALLARGSTPRRTSEKHFRPR